MNGTATLVRSRLRLVPAWSPAAKPLMLRLADLPSRDTSGALRIVQDSNGKLVTLRVLAAREQLVIDVAPIGQRGDARRTTVATAQSRSTFGLRDWWQCPACDRRCAVLIERDGRFACRRCAGLPHRLGRRARRGRERG